MDSVFRCWGALRATENITKGENALYTYIERVTHLFIGTTLVNGHLRREREILPFPSPYHISEYSFKINGARHWFLCVRVRSGIAIELNVDLDFLIAFRTNETDQYALCIIQSKEYLPHLTSYTRDKSFRFYELVSKLRGSVERWLGVLRDLGDEMK